MCLVGNPATYDSQAALFPPVLVLRHGNRGQAPDLRECGLRLPRPTFGGMLCHTPLSLSRKAGVVTCFAISVTLAWREYYGSMRGASIEWGDDDQIHLPVGKQAFELAARQALRFNHAPERIGHGELKDRICKIDGNGSSIHVGHLSFDEHLMPTPMNTSAPM